MCFFLYTVAFTISLQAQSRENFTYTVSGTVKNAQNKALLPGVRVEYEGVTSSMTGDDGRFTLKLPSDKINLKVTVPGYTSKLISVRGREEIIIELYPEGFKSVFESMIVPGGESSPVGVTNAWSSINENNILSTAVTADENLQGKVSGLNLIHHSGSPAAGSNMYIRGLNTMNAGMQPLFIVDGMPYENSIYSTSLLGNYFSNPLASIDPKDIESITVLKDGTSQYGVKGANGVVLIRTIRAKDVETKINFHLHTGINFEPSNIPVLNGADQKLLLFDILQSQGMTGSQIMALPYMNEQKPVLEKWGYDGNTDYYRYNKNTDWQKDLYDAPTFNQDYYLNISGGDETAIYALSVGYMNQKGVVKNTDFDRFNTRFNAEVNLSKKFALYANMSFLFSSKNLIDEGPSTNRNPIYAALVKAPFMAANVYNEQNAISPVLEDYDIFDNSNPYSLINTSDRNNSQYRFVGNIEGVYKFNNYLKADGMIGVNFNKEREKLFFPNLGVYFDTLSVGPVRNETEQRVDRLFSLYGKGAVTYNNTFAYAHKLNATIGVRYQHNEGEDDWGKGSNTGSDNFKSVGYGDPLYRRVGGQISNWNWLNIYGGVDYGYQDRYFLSYSMAADASSRYGENASSFYVYPSISGAWLISGESFMKDVNLFDYLKLRAGYGLSGNDDIGNYRGVQYYVPQNILGNYGIVRGSLVDLNLKPETAAKLNVGLDAAFLNERVSLSFDFYQNKTKDMLVQMPSPKETGYPYYWTNAGEMKNTGFDFSLNSRILNGTVKWDLGFMVSKYKNEVTDLEGQEYITSICGADILTRVGEPLGVFYGYKTEGVYATQQEADNAGLNIQKGSQTYSFSAGDVKFANVDNSNNLIDENDRVIIGDPNPDLYGSIFTTLKYQRWDLNVFMTYSLGNDVYNYTRAQLESMSNYNNQTQAVRNRWRAEGDITSIPRAVYGDPMGNARFSDRWIEDGSYIRMKSVTLSYKLPLNWGVLRACTFYATGDNLLTLTKYKGLDPEFALGKSPLYNGIDATFVPMPKTLSLGFKLEL